MGTHYTVTLAMLVGFGLGAVAVQGLHAQSKAPVYQITEIDVTDQEGYAKNYVPRIVPALKEAGARFIVQAGKTYPFEGEPPKRIVVLTWDSIEKAEAFRDSAVGKELQSVRDKYAKFRSFAVEGLPQ
jgi:uncharacterized protein (DUF1330 family)